MEPIEVKGVGSRMPLSAVLTAKKKKKKKNLLQLHFSNCDCQNFIL